MSHISPWLYAIPFISAFIHWLTIWMALKLLFHPRYPKRIFGFTLHGVFPKRQRQIAESLGRIVGQELLSFGDIEQTITHPDNVRRILPLAEEHIDHFLRVKLKEAMPMISMFIGEKTIGQLKTTFMNELEQLFPIIMKSYASICARFKTKRRPKSCFTRRSHMGRSPTAPSQSSCIVFDTPSLKTDTIALPFLTPKL